MPRTSARARRAALAARIARYLLGPGGTRLVIVDESAEAATVSGAHDLGGWSERALADVLEAHLRPGQRRRAS